MRCSVCTVHIKWSVDTSECDSWWFALIVWWICGGHATSREDSSMNLDVNVCKNQRRVCFIRGEELKRVGRTIFIKSKMLLFASILIISTWIFKIPTFVYQVIILLIYWVLFNSKYFEIVETILYYLYKSILSSCLYLSHIYLINVYCVLCIVVCGREMYFRDILSNALLISKRKSCQNKEFIVFLKRCTF